MFKSDMWTKMIPLFQPLFWQHFKRRLKVVTAPAVRHFTVIKVKENGEKKAHPHPIQGNFPLLSPPEEEIDALSPANGSGGARTLPAGDAETVTAIMTKRGCVGSSGRKRHPDGERPTLSFLPHVSFFRRQNAKKSVFF